MLDDLDRLRNSPHLLDLLSHYARLGEKDREIWHNRLMRMEGTEPPDLVKLHGELIAFGWIDQNSGQVPICYRVTLHGQRAVRQAQESEGDDVELVVSPEKTLPKFPRKKPERSGQPEALSLATSE